MPEINPGAPPPVIPAAPDAPVSIQGVDADDSPAGHVAITRELVPEGEPKLPLQPSKGNFLSAPGGKMATTLVRPYLTPFESLQLALTSRGLHAEINGDPAFRLSQRYMQLRMNYVQQRKLLSEGFFNTPSIEHVLILSRQAPANEYEHQRNSNAITFLNLRAQYITQCTAIARKRHRQTPLPNYLVLERIDSLLNHWDSVTSKEVLAFEEELLAWIDNSARSPETAFRLHNLIWALKGLESADPRNRLGEVRDWLRGLIDDTRERLLDLTFSDWHSADDPVGPSLPPTNRVRFFHHPPATDWTADKVLEQPADVDPHTGRMQINQRREEWTQSVAWPSPDQGEIRHRFVFDNSDSGVPAYVCVHVFNSVPATVMEDPE